MARENRGTCVACAPGGQISAGPAVGPDVGDVAQPAEAAVAAVVECVCNHPRHRELLYKTLAYVRQARPEGDVLAFMEAQPERASSVQEPFVLLRCLLRAGGVTREPGEPAGTQTLGASRASACFVRATPAGLTALVLLDPQRRIAAAVRAVPERQGVFLRVLRLCATPCTLASIREAIAGDATLAPSPRTAQLPLEASYFVDRLSEAGALVWANHHWVITEEGRRYLAAR